MCLYAIAPITNAAAFKEFTTLQAQHSKVRDIPYQVLSIQKYLKSREFSKADRDLLMALRSHSLKGIKANFLQSTKETCRVH